MVNLTADITPKKLTRDISVYSTLHNCGRLENKKPRRNRYYTAPPKEMSADLSWLSTRAVAWYDNRIGTKRTARK